VWIPCGTGAVLPAISRVPGAPLNLPLVEWVCSSRTIDTIPVNQISNLSRSRLGSTSPTHSKTANVWGTQHPATLDEKFSRDLEAVVNSHL